MQVVNIASGPPTRKKKVTNLASLDEHLLKDTYKTDLGWLHFDHAPRLQKM